MNLYFLNGHFFQDMRSNLLLKTVLDTFFVPFYYTKNTTIDVFSKLVRNLPDGHKYQRLNLNTNYTNLH
jgi:hypothetical protein